MRRILVGCGAFLAAFGLLGYAAAGANVTPVDPVGNTITVKKVVEGQSLGAPYTVKVTCTGDPIKGGTLNFPSGGGSQTVDVGSRLHCDVTETNNGGANKVTITGSPCTFTPVDGVKVETPTTAPVHTCMVKITNTFDPTTTTTTTTPTTPSAAVAAPASAVTVTPRFTG